MNKRLTVNVYSAWPHLFKWKVQWGCVLLFQTQLNGRDKGTCRDPSVTTLTLLKNQERMQVLHRLYMPAVHLNLFAVVLYDLGGWWSTVPTVSPLQSGSAQVYLEGSYKPAGQPGAQPTGTRSLEEAHPELKASQWECNFISTNVLLRQPLFCKFLATRQWIHDSQP